MFNLSGSETVALLLLALVVLGPERLPGAIRKFGKTYGELRKMATGFQSEVRAALDEPMRELRSTADAFREAAQLDELDTLLNDTADSMRSVVNAEAAAAQAEGVSPNLGGDASPEEQPSS